MRRSRILNPRRAKNPRPCGNEVARFHFPAGPFCAEEAAAIYACPRDRWHKGRCTLPPGITIEQSWDGVVIDYVPPGRSWGTFDYFGTLA